MVKERKSGVVHFTVGENLGLTLNNIAMEHMYYSMDPTKAERFIMDCLIGCPKEIAVAVLSGKLVIGTDVKTQSCLLTEYDESVHSDYIRVDAVKWARDKYEHIGSHAKELWNCMSSYAEEYRASPMRLSLSIRDMISYYKEDYDFLEDAFEDNDSYVFLRDVINLLQVHCNEVERIKTVVDYMRENFSDVSAELPSDLPEYQNLIVRRYNRLMKEGRIQAVSEDELSFDELSLMDDALDIATPVDITDGYDAGWISPEGDVYAMNGHISTMIHNTIADALLKTGRIIIPEGKDRDNPYWHLESHGWVKFHWRWILFSNVWSEDRARITPEQVKKICAHGNVKHGGSLDFGYKKETMSCAKFDMISQSNPFYLDKLFSV
jgi:hypothetical protein